MSDTIAQCAAAFFGCAAVWFVGRKESYKKWGYVFGFISQPFWYYTFWHNQQYPLLLLSLWYTYSWGQGFYNYWIKGE